MRGLLLAAASWAILSVAAPRASAQSLPSRLEIGPQFGRSITTLKSPGSETTGASGVFFGFLGSVPIAGPLAIMGQINLAVKGGTTNAIIPETPTDLELVYLEFPVFLTLRTPRIMNTAIGRIYGGVGLEQRVGCEILISALDPQPRQIPPCRTLLGNHDWSWGAGIGLDLVFQGVTTRIDLRRMIGQRNLLVQNSAPLRNRATILSGAVMLF